MIHNNLLTQSRHAGTYHQENVSCDLCNGGLTLFPLVGSDRVEVSENLGETAVAPVAHGYISLILYTVNIKRPSIRSMLQMLINTRNFSFLRLDLR